MRLILALNFLVKSGVLPWVLNFLFRILLTNGLNSQTRVKGLHHIIPVVLQHVEMVAGIKRLLLTKVLCLFFLQTVDICVKIDLPIDHST